MQAAQSLRDGRPRQALGTLQEGHKTSWIESAPGLFVGRGQRILTTDRNEPGLLEVRSLALANPNPSHQHA